MMDYIQTPFELPAVDASDADGVYIPPDPDVAFEGFGREAFAILDRLRAHPHIEQYRNDRPHIRRHLKDPFKRYRDDLVVNLVLPNRLNLETERNVFSRLLKNDFGAGGCHHHFWLSFYRPPRTRLKDIQLAHTIHPDGLQIAVIARKQAKEAFQTAREAIARQPARFLERVNGLLETGEYVFTLRRRRNDRVVYSERLDALPEAMESAGSFTLCRTLPPDAVIRRQGGIMRTALETVAELWPFYQFLLR